MGTEERTGNTTTRTKLMRTHPREANAATSVQVVPLPYPLQAGLPPLTYPLLVPLTLKAWEGLSVRGSQHEG